MSQRVRKSTEIRVARKDAAQRKRVFLKTAGDPSDFASLRGAEARISNRHSLFNNLTV